MCLLVMCLIPRLRSIPWLYVKGEEGTKQNADDAAGGFGSVNQSPTAPTNGDSSTDVLLRSITELFTRRPCLLFVLKRKPTPQRGPEKDRTAFAMLDIETVRLRSALLCDRRITCRSMRWQLVACILHTVQKSAGPWLVPLAFHALSSPTYTGVGRLCNKYSRTLEVCNRLAAMEGSIKACSPLARRDMRSTYKTTIGLLEKETYMSSAL